jgi:hypothetical protein
MTYQLRNVVIAVVLGLLAAVLTTVYVTNYRKNVQHGQQDVGVLVAATNIPAGTSGAAIVSGHMLVRKTIPRTALVPGAISSPDQISRLVSTQEVMVGEQVTKSRFGGANELGVRAQLKGTMRAIQAAANPNQILAGTLRTGDHVDLAGNMKVETVAAVASCTTTASARDLLYPRTGSLDAAVADLSSTQKYNDARRHGLAGLEAAVRDQERRSNASPDGGWAPNSAVTARLTVPRTSKV